MTKSTFWLNVAGGRNSTNKPLFSVKYIFTLFLVVEVFATMKTFIILFLFGLIVCDNENAPCQKTDATFYMGFESVISKFCGGLNDCRRHQFVECQNFYKASNFYGRYVDDMIVNGYHAQCIKENAATIAEVLTAFHDHCGRLGLHEFQGNAKYTCMREKFDQCADIYKKGKFATEYETYRMKLQTCYCQGLTTGYTEYLKDITDEGLKKELVTKKRELLSEVESTECVVEKLIKAVFPSNHFNHIKYSIVDKVSDQVPVCSIKDMVTCVKTQPLDGL